MKNLTLSIKQEFFNQILNGEKKQEFREVLPTTIEKYVKSMYLEDDDDESSFLFYEPVEYDTVTFYTGQFKGKRPGIVVEVKDMHFEMIEENGKNVEIYIDEECSIAKATLVIDLGDIIKKINI